MFGYVRTYTEELKIRENAYYQSIYCGLCRALGKSLCKEGRLSLSYDMVFLAIIRYRLEEKTPEIGQHRCPVPPFRKKPMAETDEVLSYCSAVSGLLTWHKLDDDVKDGRGLKKLGSELLRSAAGRMRKKAGMSDLDTALTAELEKLSELEKSGEGTPDSLAETSGQMLASVFAYGLDGEKKRIAYEIGRHIGRWIYFADAVDDLEKDMKKGRFNPFSSGLDVGMCRNAMLLELQAASCACDLLPSDGDMLCALTDNILRLGMPKKADELLKKHEQAGKAD